MSSAAPSTPSLAQPVTEHLELNRTANRESREEVVEWLISSLSRLRDEQKAEKGVQDEPFSPNATNGSHESRIVEHDSLQNLASEMPEPWSSNQTSLDAPWRAFAGDCWNLSESLKQFQAAVRQSPSMKARNLEAPAQGLEVTCLRMELHSYYTFNQRAIRVLIDFLTASSTLVVALQSHQEFVHDEAKLVALREVSSDLYHAVHEAETLEGPEQTTALRDLLASLVLHKQDLTSFVVRWVKENLPGIQNARQKRYADSFQSLSTMATFLSAVTATTLQFSYQAQQTKSEQAINFLWFTSLVFSLASAANSLLAYYLDVSRFGSTTPTAITRFAIACVTQTPVLYIVAALLTFLAGLVIFAFATFPAHRYIPISIAALVSSVTFALLIVLISFAGERLGVWRRLESTRELSLYKERNRLQSSFLTSFWLWHPWQWLKSRTSRLVLHLWRTIRPRDPAAELELEAQLFYAQAAEEHLDSSGGVAVTDTSPAPRSCGIRNATPTIPDAEAMHSPLKVATSSGPVPTMVPSPNPSSLTHQSCEVATRAESIPTPRIQPSALVLPSRHRGAVSTSETGELDTSFMAPASSLPTASTSEANSTADRLDDEPPSEGPSIIVPLVQPSSLAGLGNVPRADVEVGAPGQSNLIASIGTLAHSPPPSGQGVDSSLSLIHSAPQPAVDVSLPSNVAARFRASGCSPAETGIERPSSSSSSGAGALIAP